MRPILLFIAIMAGMIAQAQLQLGLFGGLSSYQGDLNTKPYQASRGALGFTAGYSLTNRFALRAGLTFARIAGADSLSDKQYLRNRNLSFQSGLTEFSLVGEYTLFNMDYMRWSPYLFGGLAVYHFNPFTYDRNHNKVFLKPLGTEGQGIPGYPESRPYSLTQIAIPLGGGVKYAVSDRVSVGLEVGLRKLFTDHLDDVSTNYADFQDLVDYRGPLAADLAYRGDEVPDGNPAYPAKGSQRGGAEEGDWYYFSGLRLNFTLGNGTPGGNRAAKKGRYGCPAVPQ